MQIIINKVAFFATKIVNIALLPSIAPFFLTQLYFSLGINVVLTMVITWSNGDRINYPRNNRIDLSLLEFLKFLQLNTQLHYDLALLLRCREHFKIKMCISHFCMLVFCSGKIFKDNSLGVAYVPAVCDGPMFAGVLIGSGLRTVDKVSITTAHEMGHTLGMNHDDEEKKTKG